MSVHHAVVQMDMRIVLVGGALNAKVRRSKLDLNG